MRVLMVGCGRMGGAMLRRWSELEDVSFTVVDPSLPAVPPGCAMYENDAALPADASFDVIVLAVKPQLVLRVAPDYQRFLAPEGVFISVVAGTSLANLGAACGAGPIVRLMPNTPVAIGRGVVGLAATDRLEQEHRKVVNQLADPLGEVFWLDTEDALDRFTAVAGSGPGYVFEIAREYAAAAQRLGFTAEDARRMVLGVMAGSVELATREGAALADLRDEVVSKGGTTEAGLAALTDDGALQRLLAATTQAAYARATELR